jgi:hypothetical protein
MKYACFLDGEKDTIVILRDEGANLKDVKIDLL